MDRLADDQAIEITEGHLTEEFVFVRLRIAAMDLEAFAGQVDADTGLINDGGGHGERGGVI